MTLTRGLLATAAAFLLVSCGGSNDNESREQQMESMAKKHGVDADVALDDKGEVASVTLNNAHGAKIGKNLELPDNFPDDVQMAPDWAIMAISPTPGGFMVHAMTQSSADATLAAARGLLTAEGWTETGFAQSGPVMTQVGFSKDDRMTNVNVMDTGANRTVQLVTMHNPQ